MASKRFKWQYICTWVKGSIPELLCEPQHLPGNVQRQSQVQTGTVPLSLQLVLFQSGHEHAAVPPPAQRSNESAIDLFSQVCTDAFTPPALY